MTCEKCGKILAENLDYCPTCKINEAKATNSMALPIETIANSSVLDKESFPIVNEEEVIQPAQAPNLNNEINAGVPQPAPIQNSTIEANNQPKKKGGILLVIILLIIIGVGAYLAIQHFDEDYLPVNGDETTTTTVTTTTTTTNNQQALQAFLQYAQRVRNAAEIQFRAEDMLQDFSVPDIKNYLIGDEIPELNRAKCYTLEQLQLTDNTYQGRIFITQQITDGVEHLNIFITLTDGTRSITNVRGELLQGITEEETQNLLDNTTLTDINCTTPELRWVD